MVPKTIRFTDLTLDPGDFLNPRHQHLPIPANWYRIRIDCAVSSIPLSHFKTKVKIWIEENLVGRYTLQIYQHTTNPVLIASFELEEDSVVFYMSHDGESWNI